MSELIKRGRPSGAVSKNKFLLDVDKVMKCIDKLNPNAPFMDTDTLAALLEKNPVQIRQWKSLNFSSFVNIVMKLESITNESIENLVTEKDGNYRLNVQKVLDIYNETAHARKKIVTSGLAELLGRTPTEVSLFKTKGIPKVTKDIIKIEQLTKQPIKKFIIDATK